MRLFDRYISFLYNVQEPGRLLMTVSSQSAAESRSLPRVCELAIEEHAAFVSLVQGLVAEQWDRPSLCAGWTVRDVIIHVAGHVHHSPTPHERIGFLWRSRFKLADAIELDQQRHRGRTNQDLAGWLAAPLPLDAKRLEFDTRIQLAELVIHQQDIRRALDLPRDIDDEVLRLLLDAGQTRLGSVAVAGARKRSRGMKLTATDIEWSSGDGPEVQGPAEAILLTLNGRTDALPDLTGDGLPELGKRLGTPQL